MQEVAPARLYVFAPHAEGAMVHHVVMMRMQQASACMHLSMRHRGMVVIAHDMPAQTSEAPKPVPK